MNERDVNRLWSKVDKRGDCWLWRGRVDDKGYGGLKIAGRQWKAHRAAYVATNGPIPPRLFVLHRCDTPLCVRPDHLRIGSHQDNMDDMAAKGRGTSGSRNARAKLRECEVAEIKRLLWADVPRQEIATAFRVSRAAIGHIATGHTWRGGVSSPARAA